MNKDLERLYLDAKAALAAKDYNHASELFQQILKADVDYKDAAQLLARVIQLSRRRWYNDPRLWGTVGLLVVIGIGIWLMPKIPSLLITQFGHNASPTTTAISTITPSPTKTPMLTPTFPPMAWKRVNLGQEFERDSITEIVVDPHDPEVYYVGMENAGIYKSIDGGDSWQPAHNGLKRTNVSSLIIDSEQPETLYAGIISEGVYKTNNGAKTWQAINSGIEFPGGPFLSTVVMDPKNHSHLFYTDSIGLYETNNGGQDWEKLEMPVCPKIISSLVIPQDSPDNIYIADREKSEECNLGIYRSLDGGKTWDTIPVTINIYLQLRYGSLSVASEPQPAIFISGGTGAGERLYRTLDYGTTWDRIIENSCFGFFNDTDRNGNMYCGNSEPDQLMLSQDGGNSWNPILNDKFIREVILSPHSDNTLIAGDENSGLFISSDGGLSWSQHNNGLGGAYLSLSLSPFDNTTLLAEGGGSIYRSKNSGQTWEFLTDQGSGLAFDADGKTMYILANAILKSEDDGETWQRTINTRQVISSFITHPIYPNVLIAIHESGFSISYNGGQNWDQRQNIAWKNETDPIVGKIFTTLYTDRTAERFYILINSETTGKILGLEETTGTVTDCQLPAYVATINYLAIDPRDSDKLIISSPGNGLLTSTDGCQTWKTSNSGLGSLFVNTIVNDQNSPDTIYAGTDGGAYVSFNGGQTWGQVNDGLLGATVVYSIAVDSESSVYAATPYGIFKLEGK